MKNSIEKVLTDMTGYFSLRDFKVMNKAVENMDTAEVGIVVAELMDWLSLQLWLDDKSGQYSAEYSLMSEIHRGMFNRLTGYCPEVLEVFVLDGDRVRFNSKLTKEEIQEVIDFVDANYDAPFTSTNNF